MSTRHYDLVVIGAGAAGLAAARTGVGRGARTLLVSDGEPGGDCTFSGCVPSKTLIESARAGLSYTEASARIRDAVAHVAAGENTHALRSEGIDVRLGRAWFTAANQVTVDRDGLTAQRFVIATDSRPQIPSIPGLGRVNYQTNETVFDQTGSRPVLPAHRWTDRAQCKRAHRPAPRPRLASPVSPPEGAQMTTAHAQASTSALPGRLAYGVAGGLAGGVVFGLLMQMMGMIPMVAMLVGTEAVAVGWLVHLAISAFIGATFGLLLGAWAGRVLPGALLGMGYGVVWWVLGALVIMPAQLGMPVFMFNTTAWQSLMGHLLYGLVLGLGFATLAHRQHS